jgi:hypothetical protein
LTIEVTLLLQSNSEEIERISFVQHYKRRAVESKATIQPFATDKGAGSQRIRQLIRNEGSNESYKRGALRATETIRIVCKETLQSLVTKFTNMELKIRVKRFTRTTEAIADYVGREYSNEMRLLVKNQKENEPKEPVMPGKEEVKLMRFTSAR